MAKVKIPSTTDILNMDLDMLQDLNRSTLARLVSRVADTANKRVKRMDAKELSTPALRAVKKKGEFSVKGKDTAELISELNRAKRFLTAKTGSFRGYKTTMQQTRDTLKSRYGIDTSMLTDDELGEAFNAIKRSKSLTEEVQKIHCNTILITSINESEGYLSKERLREKVSKAITQMYEKDQEDNESVLQRVRSPIIDDTPEGYFD